MTTYTRDQLLACQSTSLHLACPPESICLHFNCGIIEEGETLVRRPSIALDLETITDNLHRNKVSSAKTVQVERQFLSPGTLQLWVRGMYAHYTRQVQ